MEDTRNSSLKFSTKVTKLEEEIVRFDAVLDRIQRVMPEDVKVYDRIMEVRDAVFRLQQQMRGLDIIEFVAPWIDPADIFWEKKEEDVL
jgi:hypothetical protein